MKQHYLVLDSFRGICACIVALSHFNANSIINGSNLLDRGSIYVDFFFVLSGFVIFANYQDKLRSGYSIGKFILLRVGRIYPLHFCVLMAFVSFDFLQFFVHIDGAAINEPFSAPGESPRDIIAALFLIHSLNVTENLAFNGPSWSVSVEFYTYILFAFILAFAGKFYKIIIALAAIISAALLYFIYGELYAKLDYGFLRCVYGFACGSLTWMIYQSTYKNIRQVFQNKYFSNLIETSLLGIVVIYIWFFSFGTLSFAAPLMFSTLVYIFAFEEGRLSRFLKIKFLTFLGTLSYSIYMIHLFISGKLFALPVRLLENRMNWNLSVEVDGKILYGTNLFYGTLFEVFYLFVVIILSYISYKIIEDPCRAVTKKLAKEGLWFRNKRED